MFRPTWPSSGVYDIILLTEYEHHASHYPAFIILPVPLKTHNEVISTQVFTGIPISTKFGYK
jgi:hypothetical protein